MALKLREHQLDAINKMHNGCLLCGGVGTGKTLTSLGYYYLQQGGSIDFLKASRDYIKMKNPKDLYVITTAHKRDTREWEMEMTYFYLSTNKELNTYNNKIIVDSWNNIQKYENVKDAFFIFDEQRVVGYGAWSKAFIKIAKVNNWILLSATPGDTWSDYMSVFIANGFYRNKTEFVMEHVIYKPHVTYNQIDRYVNVGRLIRLRRKILVDMEFYRHTIRHDETIYVNYDKLTYRFITNNRKNPFNDYEPIKNASEYCFALRKLVNSDESRQIAVLEILEKHPKAIIFYNYDYELNILRDILSNSDFELAEWNGHLHQEIPYHSDKWVYLVNYTSGCEGWNCIQTDTIIFYSQTYSYKTLEQSKGRIDRMNTPFIDLYYYHLKTRSGIDLAISRAINNKKHFNESAFSK